MSCKKGTGLGGNFHLSMAPAERAPRPQTTSEASFSPRFLRSINTMEHCPASSTNQCHHKADLKRHRSQGTTLWLQIVGSASDAIFGTRSYTAGARMQLPRKVPLRVEPKSFFGEYCPLLLPSLISIVIAHVFTALPPLLQRDLFG